MNRLLTMALAAPLLALAHPAMAACTGFAISVQQTSATSYDPSELTANRLTLRLTTGGALDSACETVKVSVGPHDFDPRPMVLQNGPSDLLGTDPGTAEAVREGRDLVLTASAVQRLVAGLPVSLDIQDITPGQFVRSGPYTAIVTVAAGDQAQDVTLQSDVRPVILLQASSADGQEDIDLGALADGATGETSVFYRTNADLSVTIESENRGFLVHERGAAIARIAYVATFGGSALNLTAPTSLSYGFSQIGLQAKTISVTVPTVPDSFAGAYRDTLTISFTPY